MRWVCILAVIVQLLASQTLSAMTAYAVHEAAEASVHDVEPDSDRPEREDAPEAPDCLEPEVEADEAQLEPIESAPHGDVVCESSEPMRLTPQAVPAPLSAPPQIG